MKAAKQFAAALGGFVSLVQAATIGTEAASSQAGIQPSTFTVPGKFPTSLYQKYYNNPTQTASQVQPVISDPVSHIIYPLELTDPDTIPANDTEDPNLLPAVASSSQIFDQALAQIISIANNSFAFGSNTCAQCQASLEIAKFVALAAPEQGPQLAVAVCEAFQFSKTCQLSYGIPGGLGNIITQVVATSDVGGYDGAMLCQNFLSLCGRPPTPQLDLTGWFATPKPDPLPTPKQPSGERLKVLHLSDLHLDPRYATGAEANCTSADICCRSNVLNSASPNQTLLPAPRYGSWRCDAPYALITSALEAIPPLTGTEETGFAWTIFTGDLVPHDPNNQLSEELVEYQETVLYDLMKRTLGSGPVYTALGNHDTYHEALDSPHNLGGNLTNQFSWNYDHVSALWQEENWIPSSAANTARATYGAYAVQRSDGLRVITLNTDFWYTGNYFAFINLTNPDNSGILRFLTDELQEAEDAGDRVWIMGHVLPGWDGTNALESPTNLFYQIVDRFSPHVIAGIFFGHSHEDELSIFYANNGTVQNSSTALNVEWIGPSVSPLENLNSGFRVYEVDSATFDILDSYTWFANVGAFPALDDQIEFGPTFEFEYSARDAYGVNITWGENDPLNGTWWHLVTEQFEANPSLVSDLLNKFQGKSSEMSPPCTGDCTAARICYLRSASASLALQNCIAGFGSVQ